MHAGWPCDHSSPLSSRFFRATAPARILSAHVGQILSSDGLPQTNPLPFRFRCGRCLSLISRYANVLTQFFRADRKVLGFVGSAHYLHRARRMARHRLRNASHKKPIQSGATMRADHDHVRMPFRSRVDQFLSRVPFFNGRRYAEPRVLQCPRRTRDNFLRPGPRCPMCDGDFTVLLRTRNVNGPHFDHM
jgi:hypothetical protein